MSTDAAWVMPGSAKRSAPAISAMAVLMPALQPGTAAAALPDLQNLTPAQTAAEAGWLRSKLAAEVPHLLSFSSE